MIYGDTSTHIDVAEVVASEVRWWDLLCVSTRGGSQFPSVLLQPLGHFSVFRINKLRAVANNYRTRRSNSGIVRPSRSYSTISWVRWSIVETNSVTPH